MSLRPIALALAGLLVTPPLAPAQSLWREGAYGSSLFADHRARVVNDLVTILIVEQSSSSRSATTKSSEDTSRTTAVNQFPTLFDTLGRRVAGKPLGAAFGDKEPSQIAQNQLGLNLSGAAKHEGKGSIARSDNVSGSIAARVVKVLDNGNLVIEGRRAVLVNDETQTITISGTIRPQDITGTNTVLSSQISDAEIQMVGRGILAEAQRPGILYRILDWLRLF